MSTPFPSGNFIDAVRESSKSLTESTKITINKEGIERLLRSEAFTSSFKRLSVSHGLTMPLKFPSILSELNLISVLSVLNFASGYRVPLHRQTGRGAFDTIRVFVLSTYLASSTEGDYFSASGMGALNEQKVAEFMGLLSAIHVEKPHERIPGIVMGELGGPMYELVRLVTRILNETGAALKQSGYPDLGSFVVEALERGKGDAEVVLQRLVRGIPAFRDMDIVNGQPVYIFKKALLLIHVIHLRFSSSSPFPVPETSMLPVFSDNVLPSMLVHLGIIDLSTSDPKLGLVGIFPEFSDALLGPAPAKEKKEVPKAGPVLTTDQAYILRAAAVEACEEIVKAARLLQVTDESLLWMNTISLPELDAWLWAGAKDRDDYRRLERFVTIDTEFF